MKLKKNAKLKDVLPLLDALSDIVLYQGDTKIYYNPKDSERWEEIYRGGVFDVPWWIMNYYLTNGMKECIGFERSEDTIYFAIYLVEDKEHIFDE